MTQADELKSLPKEIWVHGQTVYKSPNSVYSCNSDGSRVILAKDSPECTKYIRADLIPVGDTAAVKAAVEALEFYADDKNWSGETFPPTIPNGCETWEPPILLFGPKDKARSAVAKEALRAIGKLGDGK